MIAKKNDQQIIGELVAVKVKQRSLLLLESESKADVSVDVKDIKVIKIMKKSKAFLGFGSGSLVGATVGAVVAIVVWALGSIVMSIFGIIEAPKLGQGAWIGGCIGAIIGVTTGGIVGKDKTIQIEGKSYLEIEKVLQKLQKKARIPDYK